MNSEIAPHYARDEPATQPLFDFDVVAHVLASALSEPHDSAAGATVLGIHGPWGSGKTTLMKAVRRSLEARPGADRVIFLEFNAWKYRDRVALWRALILTIIGGLRDEGLDEKALDELQRSLYRTVVVSEAGPWQVNWRTLIVEIASLALSIVRLDFIAAALRRSSGFLGRLFGSNRKADEGAFGPKDIERLGSVLERTTIEREIQHVQSIEQFLDGFRDLMERARADGRRLCVFIDDLDRCLPDEALEIFESVKLFLDASGCSFVVALDRDVIRKGLALRYPGASPTERAVDPDEYVEKTISISYDLPRLSERDTLHLVSGAQLPFTLSADDWRLLRAGLGANPRRIKRFVNLLTLHCDLAAQSAAAGRPVPEYLRSAGPDAQRRVYLKLLLLSYRYSAVLAACMDDPALCTRLQGAANAFAAAPLGNAVPALEERTAKLAKERLLVRQLATDESFWRMMACSPDLGTQTHLAATFEWFREQVGFGDAAQSPE